MKVTYWQGVEFTSWCEWISMDIRKESLNDFSEFEIIVHRLHEMTFVGFSEEVIQESINKIERSKMERESMTVEEINAVTASV
ncbi:MAG: DUF6557 family protein [Gelidibacter sp.]